jgi:hypothetical protein
LLLLTPDGSVATLEVEFRQVAITAWHSVSRTLSYVPPGYSGREEYPKAGSGHWRAFSNRRLALACARADAAPRHSAGALS